MSTSLLNIVGKLSEIYKKKKQKKKMQRMHGKKKNQVRMQFIGPKNNKLHYKCKVCKKKMVETSIRINQKVFKCV